MRWPDRLAAIVGATLLFMACNDEGQCLFGGGGNEPRGDAQHGDVCMEDVDCVSGLVCGGNATCLTPGEPGTADVGEACVSSQFCRLGLLCGSDGTCAEEGSPGTAGLGESCTDTEDCLFGYACEDSTCYGFDFPLWAGASCETSDDGPFRAYFEIPGQEPLADFYRLPFPNDARVGADGHPDLSGHPSPGALIPALGDVVGDVLTVFTEDFEGWGNNQAVFMRFSDAQRLSTITLGDLTQGGSVGIMDITPGSPEYSLLHPMRLRTGTGRQAYLCQNWVTMWPSPGRPYLPGHTYVAYITTDVTDDAGTAAAQDDDFAPMLGVNPPADPRLQPGYAAYAPVRAWLSDRGIPTSRIASAAVFTVGDPTEKLLALHDAVQDVVAPTVTNAVVCGDDPGPYADPNDASRGCHGADPAFYEIQAQITLPRWQEGVPPFKESTDGGGVDFSDGTPVPAAFDDVPVTITVPKGVTMPVAGWPVLLYAHGTGGNYRSVAEDGTAELVSSITTTNGTIGFVTISIDEPMHGPRAFPGNHRQSWLALDPHAYDPDVLYYNPLNVRAARDNQLQAAADFWYLTRLVSALEWESSSPTGSGVTLDTSEIWYLGHSQGASAGPLAVAYEPALHGAVLSAGGGLLIESLLHKTNPNNIPAAVAIGLADPAIERGHPLLNIAQGAAERSDGVNHGAYVFYDALGAPRSMFQVYGVGDTYTPDETQYALARAMRVDQVPNGNAPLELVSTITPPVTGNKAAGTATGVVGLYARFGANDAHFVFFDRTDTRAAVQEFLATGVQRTVPTVPAP